MSREIKGILRKGEYMRLKDITSMTNLINEIVEQMKVKEN